MKKETTTKKDYWVCEACGVNSSNSDKIPCSTIIGCKAVLQGQIVVTQKVVLTKGAAKRIPKKKTSKTPDIVKSVSDEYGNMLISKNNGKRVVVSLKLVSESKSRRIGVINIARKSIDIQRQSHKHLFRKSNSYGFNHSLLLKTILFENIRLRDERNEWFIPKDYILEKGHYLNFLNSGGFELQIFIKLEEIEQFKRNPKI